MPTTPTPAETLRAAAERTTDPALAGLLGKLAEASDHHGDSEVGVVATLVHSALAVARQLLSAATAEVPQATADSTRIVAYRDPCHPRVLLCRDHGARWHGVVPVTSEDLPDGGICTFGRLSSYACGRDVLTAPDEPTR